MKISIFFYYPQPECRRKKTMNAFICSSLGIFSTLCRKYIANIVLRYQREIDRCCAVYGVLYVLDAFYEMCASVTLVNNTICTFYPPYDCRVFLFFVLFFALAWSFWCCRIFYIFFFGRRYEIFLNVLWWLCAATIAVLMLSSFPFSILMFFSFTFIRSVSVFFLSTSVTIAFIYLFSCFFLRWPTSRHHTILTIIRFISLFFIIFIPKT